MTRVKGVAFVGASMDDNTVTLKVQFVDNYTALSALTLAGENVMNALMQFQPPQPQAPSPAPRVPLGGPPSASPGKFVHKDPKTGLARTMMQLKTRDGGDPIPISDNVVLALIAALCRAHAFDEEFVRVLASLNFDLEVPS